MADQQGKSEGPIFEVTQKAIADKAEELANKTISNPELSDEDLRKASDEQDLLEDHSTELSEGRRKSEGRPPAADAVEEINKLNAENAAKYGKKG